MSATQRIKQGFLRLPLAKKTVLVSSFVTSVSPILPWWDIRSSAELAQVQMGLTGPLWLCGAFISVFGAISFLNLFIPLMGKNYYQIRQKCGRVSMMFGAHALVVTMVAHVAFLHPQFLEGAALKSVRFGLFAAYFGIALMLISGAVVFNMKEKAQVSPEEAGEFTSRPMSPVSTPSQDRAPQARPLRTLGTQAVSEGNAVPIGGSVTPDPQPARPLPGSRPAQNSNNDGSGIPSSPNSPYSRPAGAYQGDPLQLDAKTRYKMMRARQRASNAAQNNLWGGNVTENMKIRTDL